jgi:glycosyltransferase involved in cell wall biosynthesis
LIRAVLSLRARTPAVPVRLILVGSGPKGSEWQKWVERDGGSHFIRFIGQKPYDDMPDVLGSADCLVLPSIPTSFWEEQFGYALVEAMAMGLVVISTESGAIPEVVGDAAVVVPPASSEALAAALQTLYNNPSQRAALRGKGMERAAQRYDARKVAERLQNLYLSQVKR